MSAESPHITGAINFRDFGGILTADGRRIKRNRLFRSGELHELTSSDFEALNAIGVATICDLRSKKERESRPVRWTGPISPKIIEIDVAADIRGADREVVASLRDNPTGATAERTIIQFYSSMPKALLTRLPGLFGHLTEDNGAPIIISCAAGKDRTGLVSALLLFALTASREQVYENYLAISIRDHAAFEQRMVGFLQRMLRLDPPKEFVAPFAAVKTQFLDAALEAINLGWGSVEGYLAAAGLSAARRERLLELFAE